MIEKQGIGGHTKGQRKNRGSAIIEMTMLIPIFLGIFYLYIMFFLFLIECGFLLQGMVECIYNVETKSEIHEMMATQQGNTKVVKASKMNNIFPIYLELKGSAEDSADKVRRWQIAVDTIS